MKVAILPVTPFQQNCTLPADEAGGQAAVVEPGTGAGRTAAGTL